MCVWLQQKIHFLPGRTPPEMPLGGRPRPLPLFQIARRGCSNSLRNRFFSYCYQRQLEIQDSGGSTSRAVGGNKLELSAAFSFSGQAWGSGCCVIAPTGSRARGTPPNVSAPRAAQEAPARQRAGLCSLTRCPSSPTRESDILSCLGHSLASTETRCNFGSPSVSCRALWPTTGYSRRCNPYQPLPQTEAQLLPASYKSFP